MAGPYFIKTPANGGSDTHDGLSLATAFATINKAYLLCTGGEFVNVDDGTYAEGTTFWSLSRNMTSTVTIQGLNGTASNVNITGVSGTSEILFTSATNLLFQDLNFPSRNNLTSLNLRWNAGVCHDITFRRCHISAISNPGQVNTAIKSLFGAAHTTNNIIFDNCIVDVTGNDAADTINFVKFSNSDTLDGIKLINGTRVISTRHGVILSGVTNALIDYSCTVTCTTNNTGGTSAGTGVQLGTEGTTGFTSSGTINAQTITVAYGHGVLIVAGVTSATVQWCTIQGGNTANGQGLVVKECSGVYLADLTVYAGATNGLYFKGAHDNVARRVTVINTQYPTSYCLHMGYGDTGDQSYNNDVQHCTFIDTAGPLVYWGSSTEIQANNICDYNVYKVSGNGNWGSWQNSGTSNNIASLGDLKAKQGAYLPGNDSHSVTAVSDGKSF